MTDQLGRRARLARALGGVVPRSPRSWDLAACLVGVVLFVVSWPTLFATHDVPASLAPAVAAISVLPFALVRVSALTAWALTTIAAAGIGVVLTPSPGYGFPWQPTHFLVMLATLAAVAAVRPSREVAASWALTVSLVVGFMPAGLKLGWAFGVTMVVAAALLLRSLLLSRRQLMRQEQVSEAERARRAALEERSRIARDLHDVVAHRMSMVVVQAQSASRRLEGVPPHVADELEAIGSQARAALNEVRGMLGVLRSDGQLPEEAPQPGLGDLEALLVSTRNAGVDVTWSLTGDLTDPGGAIGMVVYRILQESLANATRHAAGSRVLVRVERDAGGITCSVENTSPPSPAVAAASSHPGTGLASMSTRAEAVGGTLLTEPTVDGGFAVHAWIPEPGPPVDAPATDRSLG